MLSKFKHEDPGVSKWHLAVAVAGIASLSAGIYYYYLHSKSSKKSDDKPKKEEKEIVPKKEEEKDITKLEPAAQAQHHKLIGNDFYKVGKFEDAIKSYNTALELCPDTNRSDLATYYQNRAAAYEQMKNWEGVMSDCTKALDYNAKYVKALSRRAKACEVLEDLDQSLEDLTAVCILESFSNDATLMGIDRVLKRLGKEHAKTELENKVPVSPSKYFIKAYFESFTEDPLVKIDTVENGCVESDTVENGETTATPVDTNLYQKAKQYLKESKLEKVINCCTTELSNPLSELRPKCLLMRATMYILRGENKDAFDDLHEIIGMADIPEQIKVNALIKRGILYMQHEDVDNATADLDTAAKVDPKNADVFHHKGQVLLLLNKVEDAIVDFGKAVKLNGNYPVAIVQKSYTDFRYAMETKNTNRIEEVKNDFEDTIKRFPECAECYMLYAQVLGELSEFGKASEVYDQLEKVDPTNPNILVHRSMLVLQADGDMVKAKELIEKALQIDATCQLAYENLATIEVQLGNLKAGVELFDKAIKIAKTGMELTHLCSLRDAAKAQVKVVEKLGIRLPNLGMMA